MSDRMESVMESIIEIAAKHAVVEVPKKMLASLREKVPNLELKVEGNLSEDQKRKIQALSENFRYDFVLTPYKEEGVRDIVCGASKVQIQLHILKSFQEYGDITAEIWQGESEASIKERREEKERREDYW